MNVKAKLAAVPVLGPLLKKLKRSVSSKRVDFVDSADYWENRYKSGGNSGSGSYNELAEFKAEVLNAFVAENGVRSVMEFGCGDGNQLTLAEYPQYTGFDVSSTAVELCRSKFGQDPTKTFALLSEYAGEQADLTMSLDVIYHLVEDEVFNQHMQSLFSASRRFVAIYASNEENPSQIPKSGHVKHRKFSDWVDQNATGFKLVKKVENRFPGWEDTGKGSFADFYFYGRE